MNILQEKIDLFFQQKELLFEESKAYCQNTDIPFEIKWEFLINNSEFGELSDRTDFGLDRDDEFLYDGPMYMQKYEVRDVKGILYSLMQNKNFAITEDEIKTFKQYCLDEGITKMKFDW